MATQSVERFTYCVAHYEATGEIRDAHVADMCFDCLKGHKIRVSRVHPRRHENQPTQVQDRAKVIIQTVATEYGLSVGELLADTNAWEVSRPRAIAMYLLRKHTYRSLPDIGRLMGGFHHTTILYHVNKVCRQMKADAEFRSTVVRLAAIAR